jgi:hypothetical protein
MTKNSFSVLEMLAMVLAFGFVFAGCAIDGGGEPYDGPKSIKIIGFNLQEKEALHFSLRDEVSKEVVATTQVDNPTGPTITFDLIDWSIYSTDWETKEPWTGIGKYWIEIEVNPGNTLGGARYFYSVDGTNPALIDIKDAETTVNFSNNIVYEEDYNPG